MTGSGDSIAEHSHQLALCSYCPKMCRAVCPVAQAEARETTTPWGKMWQTYRVVEHRAPLDLEVSRIFDACTGCGACTTFCEHAVETADALFAARRMAYTSGCSPRASLLAERFDALGRTCAEDLAELMRSEVETEESATALLPGAGALLCRPGLAALTTRTLSSLGIDVGSPPAAALGLEVGQPLLWAGLFERFDDNARRLAGCLSGLQTIVCLDPEDAYFLSVVYPERGIPIAARVTTVVEELARCSDRLPKRPGPILAYHDPCYLGRRLGVFGAPRRVVERVLTEPPLEFAWSRDHSECVGGGGLYPDSNPQGARKAALRRWESRPAGASGIVTACPRAEALLLEVGAEALDVIELVAGERVPPRRGLETPTVG